MTKNLWDITDIEPEMMFSDTYETKADGLERTSDEVCILCKNNFGMVDLDWMSKTSGIPIEKLISDLRGSVILQDPAAFEEDSWDISIGWKFTEQYLCGNIAKKLATAKEMNERFPHCFDANIKRLTKILPKKQDFEDIHASLGASWISPLIYATFIKDLLRLNEMPEVTFNKDLSKWKIITKDAKISVLNNYTYGTSDMSAIKIIENTMNAKTIKAYDYDILSGFRYKAVINRPATLAAQDKQRLILNEWDKWINSDINIRKHIREEYNSQFVGYAYSPYDGSFLTLPELNPEVKLYEHQRNAIARILLSGNNTLLAHDVGTGKTYEMIISAHELKRMGLSDRTLIIVPNNILKATVEMHKYLYPNDKILAVYPKDFTPEKRKPMLSRIQNDDFTVIYMAYSSFDMITMSKHYWINKKNDEIKRLSASAQNKDRIERRMIENKINILKKQLHKYICEGKNTPWQNFEELGITTLFLDEAHNYKNISIYSRTEGIVGFHIKGSKKADEMLEKCHNVKRLVFATGTPLTNSLADLFTLQTYLQPEELKFHNMDFFDQWITTFATREQQYEVDVDGNNLRLRTRFSKFHNLTELMALFSSVCDFHHLDTDSSELPDFKGYTDIPVPKNEAQEEYINGLSERLELIRTHSVSPTEDNLLKLTIDGRKCALDARLVETDVPFADYRGSKSAVCAEKIKEIYDKYPGTCQAVFCDIGTPKSGFNVYDCLKSELIKLGISRGEIAYIHDAASESAKVKLFNKINSGEIRVIIGSTSKLGVGVNVQEKLIAAHHLSVPWRPADIVQRDGRIIRRGNTCGEVFIYRYITQGSFDSYSWQILESKQRFIASFLSGTTQMRDADDIDDTVLTYAEAKMLAIGNPLIKKRVEVSNKLERARISNSQRRRQLEEVCAVIEAIPKRIERLKNLKDTAREDDMMYKGNKSSIPNPERIAFGEELLEALRDNVMRTYERIFDTYQGFDVVLPVNMLSEKPYIYLRSENGGNYHVDMKDTTDYGCSKRLDYFLDHLNDFEADCDKGIEQALKQLEEAKEEFLAGNPYREEVEKLKDELSEIDKQIIAA